MDNVPQIPDDPSLLEEMLHDEVIAPDPFKATNYWRVYQDRFVPELRTRGLTDYRSRSDSVLSSFGATDLHPQSRRIQRNPLIRRMPKRLQKRIARCAMRTRAYKRRRHRALSEYIHEAREYGLAIGCPDILDFTTTLAGSPEDFIQVNGNVYTASHINHYLQYAYCAKHIDFERISLFAELGPGSGKQIEVIKRLHPKTTFCVFDLAPQLYVCEQYLKTLFPESLISYRSNRSLTAIPPDSPGKIYILGAWQFPLVAAQKVDLFWNSASFQEMEPCVVNTYLQHVCESAQYVYLREVPFGKGLASSPGDAGVLERTTLKHYLRNLDRWELLDIDRSYSLGPSEVSQQPYFDALWRRS